MYKTNRSDAFRALIHFLNSDNPRILQFLNTLRVDVDVISTLLGSNCNVLVVLRKVSRIKELLATDKEALSGDKLLQATGDRLRTRGEVDVT